MFHKGLKLHVLKAEPHVCLLNVPWFLVIVHFLLETLLQNDLGAHVSARRLNSKGVNKFHTMKIFFAKRFMTF